MGQARGYWIQKSVRNISKPKAYWRYSDDEGKSWQTAKLVDANPLTGTSGVERIIEQPDGTIISVCHGYVNEDDMHIHLYGCFLCRSKDGGESWGDWSILAYDSEEKYYSFGEPTLLALSEDYWIAFMRTETINTMPWMGAMMTRTVSTDHGYTWSKPEVCINGSQPAVLNLSDGGLALIVRTHSRQQSGVFVSYDGGETWSYALAGPYNTSDAGILDDDRFWVYAGNEVVIYRRRAEGG